MNTSSQFRSCRALLAAFPLLMLSAWSAEPAAAGPDGKIESNYDALVPGLGGTRLAPRPADTSAPAAVKKEEDEGIIQLSPFSVSAAPGFGAKVGGAQDTNYFRDVVQRGQFPHPDTFTAEGLFSEHDLPLRGRAKGRELLQLNGAAMPATLITRPEVRYLAQIGFSSGLDPRAWRREPLNLVAVVDKSGSMDGQPLQLVKQSLHQVLSQLDDRDQMSIVLYGDHSHVHLEPVRTTRANRRAIGEAIDAIRSSGSTNMEAGLRVGFDLARRSQRDFPGRTRVMQFTDERPNTGDTSSQGFMGIMRAGSLDGIGQTTVGVGVQFDAKLASTISAVRGGNLFYFASPEEMKKTFASDLDTMVTELAYDLDLHVRPAPGLRLAGVYGLPGEMLEWVGDDEVRFKVSTIFLSKQRGAIYLAFAPANPDLPAARLETGALLGTVGLSYQEIGAAAPVSSRLELPLQRARQTGKGLVRGEHLVNEFLVLRAAMTAHLTENNQEKARQLLASLDRQLAYADYSLRRERQLVDRLLKSMTLLAGRGSEPPSVCGLEIVIVDGDDDDDEKRAQ